MTASIHRLIEQTAAIRGHLPAIVDHSRALSYRELNYAANAVARRLLHGGFRRGMHAEVVMPVGADLGVVLLAILKTGGSYSWVDAAQGSESGPWGVSFRVGSTAGEEQWQHVDLSDTLSAPISCNPNLPIVTRGSDVACILSEGDHPSVAVPHETIAALRSRAVPHPTPWVGEPGAFDLWMALMGGTAAMVQARGAAAAA